jgi:hypothetical protein
VTAERNYLRDVLPQLLELAREAKRKGRELEKTSQGDFYAGRRVAFYEVMATITGQLDAFGISKAELGLPEHLNVDIEVL